MSDIVYGADGTGIATRRVMCSGCKTQIEIGDTVTRTTGKNQKVVHKLCRDVFYYDDGQNKLLVATPTAYSEYNGGQHTAASWHSDWKGGIPPTHIWISRSVIIEEAIAKLQRKWRSWKGKWIKDAENAITPLWRFMMSVECEWQKKLLYRCVKELLLELE